jgi:hypothetical protein
MSGAGDNVFGLPASATFNVDQALQYARHLNLTDVMIIGVDQEGELTVGSSRMTRKDALWLLAKLYHYVMDDGR